MAWRRRCALCRNARWETHPTRAAVERASLAHYLSHHHTPAPPTAGPAGTEQEDHVNTGTTLLPTPRDAS